MKTNFFAKISRVKFTLLLAISIIVLCSCENSPMVGVEYHSPPAGAEDVGSQLHDYIIELYPPGSLRAVNVQNDGDLQGNPLQLYHLGTSSKMRLYWVDRTAEKPGGYVIKMLHNFEEQEPKNRVWDIEGQSKNEGKQLHVWSEHNSHKDNPSQLWQFYKNPDGTYCICNLHSGKYATLANTSDDRDGAGLKQSSTPFNWNLAILHGYRNSYFHELCSYSASRNWMSRIPNEQFLSQITIPGTHDSGTTRTSSPDVSDPQSSAAKTQKLYIEEQLALGVRFFDLRLGDPHDDDPSDPGIYHTYACLRRDDSKLLFSHVMSNFFYYLNTYPSETLIVLVSNVGKKSDSNKTVTAAVQKQIKSYPKKFWSGKNIPTMGQARGKIVMLSRYEFSGADSTNYFGPNLSLWGKGEFDGDFKEDKKAVKIYDKDSLKVWVQDYYNTSASTKTKYIEATLNQADSVVNKDAYLINYTSCTIINPFTAARVVNKNLWNNSHFTGTSKESLGIIVMDFIDPVWARKIYEKNFTK